MHQGTETMITKNNKQDRQIFNEMFKTEIV